MSGEEETRRSSTLALDTLSHLASTCYGPAGRSKIVRANASGGLTITSTSHKLFSALALHEPISKVVLELLIARQAKGADGGLFTVLLTTGLLRGAWRSSLPPRVVAALVPEALARCAAYARCGSLAGRLRISHLPTLLALVRGVLAPKHVALPAGDAAALQPLLSSPTARRHPSLASAPLATPLCPRCRRSPAPYGSVTHHLPPRTTSCRQATMPPCSSCVSSSSPPSFAPYRAPRRCPTSAAFVRQKRQLPRRGLRPRRVGRRDYSPRFASCRSWGGMCAGAGLG